MTPIDPGSGVSLVGASPNGNQTVNLLQSTNQQKLLVKISKLV